MTTQEASKWIAFDHSTSPPTPKIPKGAPDGVVEVVKANREECLSLARDRYGKAPPDTFPFVALEHPNSKALDRLEAYVKSEVGREPALAQWWIGRNEHHLQAKAKTPAIATLLDLISWQHAHRPDPVQFLLDLE